MTLMQCAFAAPRYDSYFRRHAELVGAVWNREGYLAPANAFGGLWRHSIPNLFQRIFSEIQVDEAKKAQAEGDMERAARLLEAVSGFGERMVASSQTKIEKLIALTIAKNATES